MYLDRIVATKKEEVAILSAHYNLKDIEKSLKTLPATKGFHDALTSRRKRDIGLIAEVKKASPSKGLIRADFEPVKIAETYASAQADCISVLTDQTYFQGHAKFLQDIRQAVHVPLLRKDFIIDELQIYEARILGADAILLIAAILNDEQLRTYEKLANSLSMDVLVEVHDHEELERVLTIGESKLIGVNNRNLRTFETSLSTTEELSKLIPEGITLISESGISTREELSFLKKCGAQGVLIGETFMRHTDVGLAVTELMDAALSQAEY
ncbi:indole-3-glycerol phosphate synthase [Paenibacillus shirakamiensis]|uniref:Indole-3-glycerol phosphate synthase n=1 Tax=Paenibacillus shirakamiensis TaxID=1265935 RepID=A0ABS4JCV0_9BACL|nr:indole-3-glycerol phosphate synthase TrpC [Paenibacillus shirakamiensis]MBP1999548.1 indole-3-glycerol phosphate synthase [Paenibacillus shirakamiensis]